MVEKSVLRLLAFLVVLLLPACGGAGAPGTPEEGLHLMTFNIRYGSVDDGENSWPRRRDLVARIIAREAPDVLAVQEALAFQLEELRDVLDDYQKLGQHREGALEGEFSGLYVNPDRVRVLGWGELWLSPTPDSVGSLGWDAALPRMAVWADISTRDDAEPIRVYGTHLDHRGQVARLESARLLTRHASGGPPAVIMGDLNAAEDSEPLRILFSEGFRSAVLLLDPQPRLGTFNGFRDPSGGDRIDHVLLGPGLGAARAQILGEHQGDAWPSDHFPVVAVLTRAPGR